MQLDDHVPSDCEAGEGSYSELQDGNHTFVVCFNGSQGVGCATYNWTIDRRSVFANLRTHVPEWLLQIDSETRTVQATNRRKNLKVYLYFTDPVLNSSAEILNSVHTSQGSLLPISGNTLENRRFGFQFKDIYGMAIATVSLDSNLLLSRQGTPVSLVAPVTFLYDSQRPAIRLSTTSKTRTKQRSIPILIKFMKSVFGFNSSHIVVSGGNLQG
ncbi:hypothetical protein LguiA_028102 [Lonicera macranthoides]